MNINTIYSVFMQGRGNMDYLAKLKPRVVKIMDAKQEEIDQIRSLTPDSFIINRIYIDDNQVRNDIESDPEGTALAHNNLILSKGLSGVDYYQVQNEQLQDVDGLPLLNRYYVALINLAVNHGYKTTVIDCSVGNLHIEEDDPGYWEYVFPTLELAQKHGFPVNCHQYSCRSFWNSETSEDGQLVYPNEWYIHRLEETTIPVLDKHGFDKLLYVVGEFGLDDLLCFDIQSKGGWQNHMPHASYREDLINVMGYLLSRSDRILGYCNFVTHANGS